MSFQNGTGEQGMAANNLEASRRDCFKLKLLLNRRTPNEKK